jgi:hypothetical protein
MFKKNALLFMIAIAVAAAQSGVVASSSAQTPTFVAIGSSAQILEAGQAVSAGTSNNGLAYSCIWSTTTSGQVVATDPTTDETESGNAWVAWAPTTLGNNATCNGVNSTDNQIYVYLQTDSTVGNRCVFNGCTISFSSPGATANLVWSTTYSSGTGLETEQSSLLGSVETALSGAAFNVAGTDIRPEDALFATKRIHASCGEGVVGGSQYLGMGYPYAATGSPSQIKSWYGASPFNVTNFSIPNGGYEVFQVGMAPVIVHVNQTDGSADGFANSHITNIDSGTLAEFLDGSYSETQDIYPGATTDGTNQSVFVLEREPLSGTYNTMEYNVPNTRENQTSQDVGLTQQTGERNCSNGGTGTGEGANPMQVVTADGVGTRTRVVGTSEMENVMFGTSTGTTHAYPAGALLGYSFWSVGNFKKAYSGNADSKTYARYLTVDGIDPFYASYGVLPNVTGNVAGQCTASTCPAGTIPTGTVQTTSGANGLIADITFQNVADGAYPIWSFLRLACKTSGNGCSAASGVATAEQSFVTFGTASSNPDFVPVASSTVVRSHFLPPGNPNTCSPISNGTAALVADNTTSDNAEDAECGGDVGGVVYTQVGDSDYANDFQTIYTGLIDNRR